MAGATLVDPFGETITSMLEPVRPSQETTEIENVLLSGEVHLQTIGAARRVFTLSVYVSGARQRDLDGYAELKSVLELVRQGRSYSGILRGSPVWELVIPGLEEERSIYRGELVFLVLHEETL